MTASVRPKIRLRDPGELVAALPYLLGFRPQKSLVLIAHRGPECKGIGPVLRADLPARRYYPELARQLLQPILGNQATGASVVVVDDNRGDRPVGRLSTLPFRRLITVLRSTLEAHDIPLLHALWTSATDPGAAWRCYVETACHGIVADPTDTAIAAASVAAGVVTFPSREKLAEVLAVTDQEAIKRRSTMLKQANDADDSNDDGAAVRKLALVTKAIEAARTSNPALTDESVVGLALALSDHRVRDACLMPYDSENTAAAEALWTELTRQTPEPERAEPACLLAMAAYLRGDGALAGMALEQAHEADPNHQLTLLLQCALQAGFPPSRLTEMVRNAATDARALIEQQ